MCIFLQVSLVNCSPYSGVSRLNYLLFLYQTHWLGSSDRKVNNFDPSDSALLPISKKRIVFAALQYPPYFALPIVLHHF